MDSLFGGVTRSWRSSFAARHGTRISQKAWFDAVTARHTPRPGLGLTLLRRCRLGLVDPLPSSEEPRPAVSALSASICLIGTP